MEFFDLQNKYEHEKKYNLFKISLAPGSFLENLPRGGKIEIFGYEGGRGSIHGNMGLHAF